MPNDIPKDKSGIMSKIMPVYKTGSENEGRYKGQYTPETLKEQLDAFFEYCGENEFKPTQPLLALWLGIRKETLWAWRTKPDRYGDKSNLMAWAFGVMESYLQVNVDSYPTGSIFLLKSTFGYKDTKNVDITTNGKQLGESAEDVRDALKRMGLDEDEE